MLDTIVPVDFQQLGQINSDTLHEHLVANLPPSSTLFVILDCCHSGSALELPFVYRSDDDGNVSMINNVKEGMHLYVFSSAGDASLHIDFEISSLRSRAQFLKERPSQADTRNSMVEGADLLSGGFSFNKLAEAQDLYAGATNFFRSFKHRKEQQAPGLGSDSTYASYVQEHKMVTMFSGCRDDRKIPLNFSGLIVIHVLAMGAHNN